MLLRFIRFCAARAAGSALDRLAMNLAVILRTKLFRLWEVDREGKCRRSMCIKGACAGDLGGVGGVVSAGVAFDRLVMNFRVIFRTNRFRIWEVD